MLLPFVVLTVVVFLALPVQRERIDRAAAVAALLIVCGRVLVSLGLPRRPQPTSVGSAAGLEPPGEHVVRLARLETALSYGSDTQAQYARSLRPLLRELLDDRLALRHGVTLATDPARCRDLVGEELWQEVVAPPPPPEPSAPGPSITRLASLVDALERI